MEKSKELDNSLKVQELIVCIYLQKNDFKN